MQSIPLLLSLLVVAFIHSVCGAGVDKYAISVVVGRLSPKFLRASTGSLPVVASSSSAYVTLSFHIGKQCSHAIRYNATFASNMCVQMSGSLAAARSMQYYYTNVAAGSYPAAGLYQNIYSDTACTTLYAFQGLFVVPGLSAGVCSSGRSFTLSDSPAVIQNGAAYLSYYTSEDNCNNNVPLQTTTFFPAEGYADDTMGVGDDIQIVHSNDDYGGGPGVGVEFQQEGSFTCESFAQTKLVNIPGSSVKVKNVYVSAAPPETSSPAATPSTAPSFEPTATPTTALTTSYGNSRTAAISPAGEIGIVLAGVVFVIVLSGCLGYYYWFHAMNRKQQTPMMVTKCDDEFTEAAFEADMLHVLSTDSSVHVGVALEIASTSVGVAPDCVLREDSTLTK